MRRAYVAGIALILLAAGCADIQVLDSTNRPIRLTQDYERVTAEGARLTFPAGIYSADFKNKLGIYYRSPDKVITRSERENRARTGGIYVPSDADPDQRQGAWFDENDSAPGQIKVKLAAPTRTYRFAEPIPFRAQTQ